MKPVPGRMTHDYDGELIVFLIGMRINRWSRVRDWLPTFRAMPPMMRELATDPDSGMVGYRLFGLPRTPTVLQYWTSLDKLYDYASNPQAKHRPAWGEFNRRARTAGDAVGIWHETFEVARAETFYFAMPPTGLAAATDMTPVTKAHARARDRIAS
ncbi:DUF4188 domain-containing protein [Microbacterium suaedae]|uniref:DUF4188 domain-containing protein n=1 Tax=Microbacterium suaedae TaxID=2067813 RepID=UPI000DA12B5C|nr:DUF4188 domain-containing protein [Microbacterium suaedae]